MPSCFWKNLGQVMKFVPIEPPRQFDSDGTGRFMISDCARIELHAEEQLTFVAPSGSEFDVARKPWGYYATPSLNSRLPAKGLQPALVSNSQKRYFIHLVENGLEKEFEEYLALGEMHVVLWLDERTLLAIENSLGNHKEIG
jgi:hypothetical protein